MERIRILGKGAEGTVALVQHKNSEKLFALKFMYSDNVDRIKREFNTVRKMNSPYIVTYCCFYDLRSNPFKGNNISILMEYVKGKDLYDIIHEIPLSDRELYRLFVKGAHDLLRGLAEMRKCGVVHRDIKPENIMVDVFTLTFTFVDFGMTCLHKPVSTLSRVCDSANTSGSPPYFSPQRAKKNLKRLDYYSLDKDELWGVGMCLSFILNRGYPLHCGANCELAVTKRNVCSKALSFTLSDPLDQANAMSLLSGLVAYEESQRTELGLAIKNATALSVAENFTIA